MTFVVVAFSSITVVNRVRRLIERMGIFVQILNTPKSISVTGCSYCLRIEEKYLWSVIETTKDLGIDIKGIFIEQKDNKTGKKNYIRWEEGER